MKSNYILRFTFAVFSLSLFGCTLNTANSGSSTDQASNHASNLEIGVPAVAGGGEVQAAMPDAVVADLYKQHDAKKSPFFQTKNRASVDKYFTKQLADLIWKDAVSSAGEIGTLDADPLYYAQDIDIKNLKVGTAQVNGDKATVPVTFTNYNDKVTLKFSLTMIGETWKIADIDYGSKETLTKWLKPAPPETVDVELGDFRGKYVVGETTCTVEYKNKGYAVKWAKGNGLEYFAMMDGNTFASSTDESEANKFVFDDDELSTGTFYRADGKTFPIRRGK